MKDLYLNNLSFPPDTLSECLSFLSEIRTALASLWRQGLANKSIRCSYRFSELPLSAKNEFLASTVSGLRGKERDTAFYFLASVDQQTPVDAGLPEEIRVRVANHVVDQTARSAEFRCTAAIVACCLDDGLLVSLPTTPLWASHRVSLAALFDDSESEQSIECDNLAAETAVAVLQEKLLQEQAELSFVNWGHLSGNATQSQQVERWLDAHREAPDFEKSVMRAVAKAARNGYRVDGKVIKSLNFKGTNPVYEVRFSYDGTNNGRMLFGMDNGGTAHFAIADFKDGNKWYDRIEDTTVKYLADKLKVVSKGS